MVQPVPSRSMAPKFMRSPEPVFLSKTRAVRRAKRSYVRWLVESFAFVSLVHSLLLLGVGGAVALQQVIKQGSHYLTAPTSTRECWIFLASSLHHLAVTGISLWRTDLRSSDMRKRVARHGLCAAALAYSAWTREDGGLVLMLFVLLEVPNPPWLLSVCLRRQTLMLAFPSSFQQLTKMRCCGSLDLAGTHVVLFVTSRLISVHYIAHAMVPNAHEITTWVAFSLLFLSALSMFDYVWTLGAQKTWRSKPELLL